MIFKKYFTACLPHIFSPSVSVFRQATEAQQPGAVARGNRGGEGQSLHRHRIHG